ncbi:MAG: DNA-directed RNA polymerase subunit H [Nanoarchaeota archaeon]|nr:DNA-directed RNA polymerase subunit H [Nanoarchaeota archaeon]MBU1644642.1 DNA-directed RNA polymerase subunit H [Nanoarchaeota archaeon]MBU1976903.1 DNA-directed RNA polymerase subunit H [Nanoarchaeota archaeon]
MAKQILHKLIAKHTKTSDSERNTLFKTYNITSTDLPKILKSDAAIMNLDVKVGDIVKIERKSVTAGVSAYYRVVVEG